MLCTRSQGPRWACLLAAGAIVSCCSAGIAQGSELGGFVGGLGVPRTPVLKVGGEWLQHVNGWGAGGAALTALYVPGGQAGERFGAWLGTLDARGRARVTVGPVSAFVFGSLGWQLRPDTGIGGHAQLGTGATLRTQRSAWSLRLGVEFFGLGDAQPEGFLLELAWRRRIDRDANTRDAARSTLERRSTLTTQGIPAIPSRPQVDGG